MNNQKYWDQKCFFELENDLDFIERNEKGSLTPIGTKQKPFNGRFNGNKKTIRNVLINKSDSDNVGLFGYVQDTTFINLVLENFEIKGIVNVGALAGFSMNTSIGNIQIINIINSRIEGILKKKMFILEVVLVELWVV